MGKGFVNIPKFVNSTHNKYLFYDMPTTLVSKVIDLFEKGIILLLKNNSAEMQRLKD